jgi:HD-GYP domain-containing protein (c-di-GMP phosphodiesterase class II)
MTAASPSTASARVGFARKLIPHFGARAQYDASQAALQDLSDLLEACVTALATALELRDDETGGHAQRVTQIALELAANVAPDLAVDPALRHGFLLHDVGKIGIPDSILLKPNPLDQREQRLMQYHTTLGVQLVSSVPHLRGTATDVIGCHHERWDGTGYPWGHKGTAIPLTARIFAVADAYDAITNDRPYQQARSPQTALTEIRNGAGTHFDPTIAEAFVAQVIV